VDPYSKYSETAEYLEVITKDGVSPARLFEDSSSEWVVKKVSLYKHRDGRTIAIGPEMAGDGCANSCLVYLRLASSVDQKIIDAAEEIVLVQSVDKRRTAAVLRMHPAQKFDVELMEMNGTEKYYICWDEGTLSAVKYADSRQDEWRLT